MQAERVICVNCGAESFSEARFCRQCGKEFSERQAPSVTEGTTRLFETPPVTSDPFANLNDWAGPLDKPDTNPISIPTGKETQILSKPESNQNKGLLIVGGAIIFVTMAIIALVLSLSFFRSSPASAPTQPQIPIVQQPPAPPQPAQPATSADLGKLIYPGAATKIEFGDGGRIMSTGDSIEKVTKWYADKLNTNPTVKTADSRIFASESFSVIITNKNGETNIVLAQGDENH